MSKRPTRKLDLVVHAQQARAHVPFLRKHLRRAHAIVSPALTELSVALVNDARMAQLHQQFMNRKGPTDVLTFELEHDRHRQVTSGEVIVCVPEARRQAKQRDIDLRMELLLYALHGMLHLCGFDDRTDRGFREMHRKEDEILIQLGIGPVFASRSDTRKRAVR